MAEELSKVNSAAESETGEYTLESILAEYKGNAYLAGEKKMSKETLEQQAARIIDEVRRGLNEPEPEIPLVPEDESEEEVTEYVPPAKKTLDAPASPSFDMTAGNKTKRHGRKTAESIEDEPELKNRAAEEERKKKSGIEHQRRSLMEESVRNSVLEAARIERLDREKREKDKQAADMQMSEDEQLFFGVGKYARTEVVDQVSDEVEETISQKAEKIRRQRQRVKSEKQVEQDTEQQETSLDPQEAERLYASNISSVKRRTAGVFLVVLIMSFFALAEVYWPDIAIIANVRITALLQLMLMAVASLFAFDVVVGGIRNLFHGRAGADTLAAAAVVASIIDSVYIIAGGTGVYGQSYCAPAAFALLCALWGTKLSRNAYKTTFRVANSASVPTVVTAEWERADEGLVLTKKLAGAHGFIDKSVECDLTENVFRRLAPLLMLASLVFALITSVFRGEAQNFTHCLAALTAVSSATSALIVFNMPFNKTARKLAGSGAALAGWSGACDVKKAIGIVVKDSDLFPENTLSLGGVKAFSDMPIDSVISYTGSLIIASGSCLVHIFGDLLKEYACSIYGVDEFSCYEGGGIGAVINGDRVLVGTGAFMNIMGVHLEPNLNLRSAVFTAINDQLAGVFIINYTPVDMVQNALVSMLRAKTNPLFAVRDFNITPAMIKSKFKISTDSIDFLSFEARYKLSADIESPEIRPTAIMSREGLSHFVEITRRGRDLVKKVRIGTAMTAVSAIAGLMIMFFICAASSFSSGCAGNVLAFLALWTLPIILLNET